MAGCQPIETLRSADYTLDRHRRFRRQRAGPFAMGPSVHPRVRAIFMALLNIKLSEL